MTIITSTRRRAGVATTTLVLTAGLLAGGSTTAVAAPDDDARTWLAAQPTDADAERLADTYFALGEAYPAERAAIVERLETEAAELTVRQDDGPLVEVAPTAALLQVVLDAGRPTTIDDVDYVAQLVGQLDGTGEARDDDSDETSGPVSQARTVLVLDALGHPRATQAADALAARQCSDGGFSGGPFSGEGGLYTCSITSRSNLSTAWAVIAMAETRRGSWQQAVAKGADWLETESTRWDRPHLVGAALAAAGRPAAAHVAATSLRSLQLEGGPDAGAVVPDEIVLGETGSGAIPDPLRQASVGSTARSVLSLDQLLPAATLTVTGPTYAVERARKTTIRIGGLVTGERVTVRIAGAARATGTAGSSGVASVQATAPKTSGTWTAVATGSSGDRRGETTVRTLAAKTLKVSLTYKSVKAGKSQHVTVTGLAKGERIRIRYRGVFIVNERVTTSGAQTHVFKVGSSRTKKTVEVFGDFARRKGSATFQVR